MNKLLFLSSIWRLNELPITHQEIFKLPTELKHLLQQYRICKICHQFCNINIVCHQISGHFNWEKTDHTCDSNCKLCDGASLSYHCEMWGGPGEDLCFLCGRGWHDDTKIYSCPKCDPPVRYCIKCFKEHESLVILLNV